MARGQYHLWKPDLCAVCVEEVKHPSMRRGVAAAARAAAVGACVNCGQWPASAGEWEPTRCAECIGQRREKVQP